MKTQVVITICIVGFVLTLFSSCNKNNDPQPADNEPLLEEIGAKDY